MELIKRLEDLEIDENDPFKNDALNRKDCAENLTTLIQSSQSPLVLAVNAPWGMGKTTFLKMWRQHLKNEGHLTLYFNAWENDYCADPMVSFISEIEGVINESEISPHEKSKLKAKYEGVKTNGVKLLKKGIPLAVRLISQGLIDIDKETDKVLDNFSEKIAEDQIKEYQEKKESISSFKKRLQEFAEEVFSKEKPNKQPIVIFVDELDRCRPSFAIELLENIKHLFSVPGFVFVLGIDNEQLAHSVGSIYGSNMDSDGYLKRFFDLEFKLPDPDSELFGKFLFERFKFSDLFMRRRREQGESKDLLDVFINCSKKFNLSLRQQIRCFYQLNIIIKSTPINQFIYPAYITFLVLIKNGKSKLYSELKNEKLQQDISRFLLEGGIDGDFEKTDAGQIIHTILLIQVLDKNGLNKYQDNLWRNIQSENSSNALVAKSEKSLNYSREFSGKNIHNLIIKKIEFSEGFNLE
jgi:hypothetical protein